MILQLSFKTLRVAWSVQPERVETFSAWVIRYCEALGDDFWNRILFAFYHFRAMEIKSNLPLFNRGRQLRSVSEDAHEMRIGNSATLR